MTGRRRTDRGVALITALLVVAIVTTAAVAMASRQQIDIRRTGNLLGDEQAWLYAVGVEGWAGQVLRRDRKENQTDYLGEKWATRLPPIAVEGGEVSGQLDDLQGRFNLNDLVGANGKPSTADVERFKRLLDELDLDPNLATAVVDWIDPDVDAGFPGGAEDDTYLRSTPPYRAANRPMASVGELRLVAGFSDKAYGKLAPFLTALPTRTAINVNTAPKEVLQSLAAGLTADDAATLVAGRGDKGYTDVNAFLKQPALAGRGLPADGLTVASDYFMVSAHVRVGRSEMALQSLLVRDGKGNTRTIMRTRETL